jgi:hypothetical protein
MSNDEAFGAKRRYTSPIAQQAAEKFARSA